MDLEAYLEHLNSGEPVTGGSEAHLFMHGVSQEALRITAEINGSYHEPKQLRALFSQLIGQPVDESLPCFRPSTPTAGKTSISANGSLSIWAANFRTRAEFLSETAP